uniref:Sterile alpha motif domain containing 7 n=1 Tax=Neogobius melanostomus TaxID=47308 RepID=A0A8C6TEK5_9GOBI
MTPREQLRKMTSLGEQGALDEKHWYRLVNGMSAGELRQRQELLMRNQMSMAPQILAQGQQRLQGVPTQFEPRFMERELVPSTEMVASEARQMHMAPHLGPSLPPHANVLPGRGFPGAAGYGFMPSEPMETVARRQELIHKQNIARMEMNAILHQKEMENAHQKGLIGIDNPMAYPRTPWPTGVTTCIRTTSRCAQEKEAEAKGELEGDKPHHQAKIDTELAAGGRKTYKDGENGLRKVNNQEGDGTNGSANDKDLSGSAFQDKFMYPSASGMPYMVPMMGNGFLPPGHSNLFLNRDEVSEDIRKWTVNDVYNFINGIPTCSEYAQTFKEHMIDGETLPLLSEEHLLDTLGLKLGPALKIRSQVSRRMGSLLYLMNMPLPAAGIQGPPEKAGDRSSEIGSPVNCNSDEMVASPRDPDLLKSSDPHETENHSPPLNSSETA